MLKMWIPTMAFAVVTVLFLGDVFDEAIQEAFPNFFPANAFGPNDPTCIELGECDLFSAPFDTMIEPYKISMGDFALVVIWGIIIGILWLRVSNTMMVGVIGVALAALFQAGFSEEAQAIGWTLLGVAIAVALYQIFIVRSHFPTN